VEGATMPVLVATLELGALLQQLEQVKTSLDQ